MSGTSRRNPDNSVALEMLDARMKKISTHWRSSRVFMGLVGGILVIVMLVAAWELGLFRTLAFGPAAAFFVVAGFPLGIVAGVLRSNSYRESARRRIQADFDEKHPGLRKGR